MTPEFINPANPSLTPSWAVRDKASAGELRVMSIYALPTIYLPRTPLTVVPLVSISRTDGHLGSGLTTADQLASHLGGRLTWALPRKSANAKLSFEGTRVRMRDSLRSSLQGAEIVDHPLGFQLAFPLDETRGRLQWKPGWNQE